MIRCRSSGLVGLLAILSMQLAEADATAGPTPRKCGGLRVRDHLAFNKNSTVLVRDYEDNLRAIVATAAGYYNIVVIEVRGYADYDESQPRELSRRRAERIRLLLWRFGLAKQRTVAKAMGRSEPVCREKTESCAEENRRVEFRLLCEYEDEENG